jgi:hypothetical protein
VALLIGVGAYTNPGIGALAGPLHDVAALKQVLIERWGFASADITTVVNTQATRSRILQELDALKTRSNSGDEVLVYFSGHGISGLSPGANRILTQDGARVLLPTGTGALVPTNFDINYPRVEDLVVGRTDLYPRLADLDKAGRLIWLIVDACFSGQTARNINPETDALPTRMLPVPTRDDFTVRLGRFVMNNQPPQDGPEPAPWPYRNMVYLAAASEAEYSIDLPATEPGSTSRIATFDNKPHGAMTDALLRVLRGEFPVYLDERGFLNLTQLHRAVATFMDRRGYPHTPQRLPAISDDQHALGNRPLLTVPNAVLPPKQGEVPRFRLFFAQNVPADLRKKLEGVPDIKSEPQERKADIVLRMAESGALEFVAPSGGLIASVAVQREQGVSLAIGQVRQVAWAYSLRAQAERLARGALAAGVEPSRAGGRFFPGERVKFVARPDRETTLLMFNINARGKVSVLYPKRVSRRLSGGQLVSLTNESRGTEVRRPTGLDMQVIYAFDEVPPDFDKLLTLPEEVEPDHATLRAFMSAIAKMEHKFTFAATELRVEEP